jgi:cation-transporting P-type ATPase 13A2
MPKWQQLLSVEMDKVGMVGDGANDLLAIKEADIGVGIRNCDSSYAASFSILELDGLDHIVRESKACERSIIEIVRFISITSFLSVPIIVIMETEAVFFSSFQLIFTNLTKYIIFPVLLAMSRPSDKQTLHRPSSNFLHLENLLMFWGNVVIGTMAILAIMIYYRAQPEYVWNTSTATLDSGWTFQASMVTSQYVFNNLYPIALVWAVYVADPWKESICKNYLLFISILLNLGTSVALSFLIPQLASLFTFTDMSMNSMGIIFGISMLACLLTIVFSEGVNWLKFYVKVEHKEITEKDPRELVEQMESGVGAR